METNNFARLDIPINVDEPEKSVSGRLSYIFSLSQYISGFWESLRDHVLYPSEFFALRAAKQDYSADQLKEAQGRFDQWRVACDVKEEWLTVAAHQTLSSWAVLFRDLGEAGLQNPDGESLRVFYGPSEANLEKALAPFTPVLDKAFPLPDEPLPEHDRSILASEPVGMRMYEAAVARESYVAFKTRMRQQFNKQLTAYARQAEKSLLEKKHLRRDAAWTALYQAGQSPKQIEKWEIQVSGEAYSQARIQQSVHKFAAAIGLTLRPSKAGPKPRMNLRPRAANSHQ